MKPYVAKFTVAYLILNVVRRENVDRRFTPGLIRRFQEKLR